MNETEHEAHFKVNGNGITNIVRDIYHFRNEPNKALQILSEFEGLPLDIAYEVINGNAKLVSVNNGRDVRVVFEEDVQFKAQLKEFETIKQERLAVEEENKKFELETGYSINEHADSIDAEVNRRTVIFINSFVERLNLPFGLK